MSLTARSPDTDENPNFRKEPAGRRERNSAWLARLGNQDGVILLGGTSLLDFRVRVAQSVLRHDMLPSYWSLCGILLEGEIFASVPFDQPNMADVPKCNGVRFCKLRDYDDPRRFPNVAVIRFAKTHKNVHQDINRLSKDRNIINLPALMTPWLGFVWGTPGSANPLSGGVGLPSAAFVETVFAMAGFELTPGLSSSASSPEAIWQSAKWWSSYYQPPKPAPGAPPQPQPATATAARPPDAVAMVPQGYFIVRQEGATIFE